MKKILLITSEFPPLPGGIGNHALNIASQLSSKRFEVTVITDYRLKEEKKELDFDKKLNFKVIRIKRHKINIFRYIDRILIYLKVKNKYDVIIASGKFPLWLVGFIYTKKKKIVIIHGSEVNFKGVKRKITNFALKRFNEIIAVSNYTKSLIDDLKLKNITVIPNGFFIHNKKNIKKKQHEDPQLITVGNVSDRKGQINVIKTLPYLIKIYPNIFYHIVGIPSEKEKLIQIATKLNVINNLHFYGKVSEPKKIELLNKSDIFIMLSNETAKGDVEGFGIAILEANALGLPAIGALNTGIEDAIKNNYSGILVAATEKEQIVNAVKKIWDNYLFFQENAIDWSKNFHWDKIIEKYISTINK